MVKNTSNFSTLSVNAQAEEIIKTFSFLLIEFEFESLSVQLRREFVLTFSKELRTSRKSIGDLKVSIELYWDSIPDIYIAKPQIDIPPKTELYYYKLEDVALSLGREDLISNSSENTGLTMRSFRRSIELRKQILLDCCEDFLNQKNYKIFKKVSKLIDPTYSE